MANYNQESNVIVRWLKVIFSWKVITGILTDVSVEWSGPIGLDDWWLVCKLGITITEVSNVPLNFNWVKQQRLV